MLTTVLLCAVMQLFLQNNKDFSFTKMSRSKRRTIKNQCSLKKHCTKLNVKIY